MEKDATFLKKIHHHTEDESWINWFMRDGNLVDVIEECLDLGKIAFQSDDGSRKMTAPKFKKLFKFQKNEIILKANKSTFIKDYQQMVLRIFIKQCSWKINNIRSIKQNQMSLRSLDDNLVKNFVNIQQIERALFLMENLTNFVLPFFTEFQKVKTEEQYVSERRKAIVKIYILFKIKKIIEKELQEKHYQSVIANLMETHVAGYGQHNNENLQFVDQQRPAQQKNSRGQSQIYRETFQDAFDDFDPLSFIPLEVSPPQKTFQSNVFDIKFVTNSVGTFINGLEIRLNGQMP